jgi:peptide/nickel transport system permease protein
LAVDSIRAQDTPLVQGTVLFIAVVFIVINLLVDLSYALLNPRIRYG